VKAVAGDRADIFLMVPPGASPHTFSPKPSDVIKLVNADLYFGVGAGFEFWAGKMIKASGNKTLGTIIFTEGMKLISEEEKDEGHGHEEGNPHVWLVPLNARKFAARVYAALSEKDPANKSYYKANYDDFNKECLALDTQIRKETVKLKRRDFVAFHPSWIYFAQNYGLNQAAVIQSTPGKNPTPRELTAVVQEVKKLGIRAVFAEPQLPKKAAEVIAKEAGVKVAVLDPLGKSDESYTQTIKRNFEIIKETLE
jgi:zinc transport system substrate-binding protein